MTELISRQKLKPCPFCGGKASTTKRERWKDESCTYSRPDYGVSCQECYAKGYQYYSTVEEAIEAWNKRTEPPADQWIPCSKGKPQTMLNVLITCDEGGVWEAYRGRNGIWTNDDWLYLKDEQVIAWQHKPEPYKGVE